MYGYLLTSTISFMQTNVAIRSLLWRHNEPEGVSNHQHHDCLLNRRFGHRSKKTSKLRVTGLCAGNSPETGEFPAQMASNAENVSILWRHHEGSTNSLTPLSGLRSSWRDDMSVMPFGRMDAKGQSEGQWHSRKIKQFPGIWCNLHIYPNNLGVSFAKHHHFIDV